MKRALVLGCSGLIGQHMVKRLKAEGHYVIGVSRRRPDNTVADDYIEVDLRDIMMADPVFRGIDEIYQFACQVGGLGFITNPVNDVAILRDSTLIDIAVLEACRHQKFMRKPPKVFFASSACVYNIPGKRFYVESDAYPANCSNEFAWQKLYAERLYQAYARLYGLDIRIGRLFNTYGTGMEWRGGREKSVAALCRKIAEAPEHGVIEVWGNGEQTRSYTYVDDAVEGIWRLMQAPHLNSTDPVNIGPAHEVSIRDLLKAISDVAGKKMFCKFGDGPSGVSKICSDNGRIRRMLGWEPTVPIEEGLKTVFPWVKEQVDNRATA